MKKLTLSLLFFTAAILGGQTAYALENDSISTKEIVKSQMVDIQCCMSYDDYAAGNWQTIGPLKMTTKGRASQLWWGGKDFNFETDDHATSELLRKKIFAINYGDTLLLNTHSYWDRGSRLRNGYAQALPTTDGRFVILYYNVRNVNTAVIMSGVLLGLAGSIASTALTKDDIKQDVCYLVTPGQKKALIINDKMMMELTTKANRPDLMEEYQQSKYQDERISANHVIPFLQEMGLLEGHGSDAGK